MENAFIHESERARRSAVWNVRLRFLTGVGVLFALGLQIGVACSTASDYEVWVSPESFVFVGPPCSLGRIVGFANGRIAWDILGLEPRRIHCSAPQKEGNPSRRSCRAGSNPLDGAVQLWTRADSDKLLCRPANCSCGLQVDLQVRS